MFVSIRMVLCETSMHAIIRIRMVLSETSMLLFVSVWCYAKPRCYYSYPYGVIRNLDAIIRVRMVLCETSMLLCFEFKRAVRGLDLEMLMDDSGCVCMACNA